MKKFSKGFIVVCLLMATAGAYAQTACGKACQLKYDRCVATGGDTEECLMKYIACMDSCAAP
ncbi:hypothetical protein ATCM_08580 [Stenotrophomonas sp. ATCM1_4]|uniref:hypothetical protein n=1 Tax=Stenotrophomonas sp. ATCM1_4 TaxID=2259330 RepID=UPI00104C9783|nr:hypothetical protein [Stenotrophomonas sp. ATCM1_4]TDB27711.1 hypothetical protein ATCM_08580 [Stenotrophomonas sp. ATCM1_4]